MPTYVFKCKGGRCKGFLIHEGELPRPDEKTPLEKHCPTCRTMTKWFLGFRSDVRGGVEEAAQIGGQRNKHVSGGEVCEAFCAQLPSARIYVFSNCSNFSRLTSISPPNLGWMMNLSAFSRISC